MVYTGSVSGYTGHTIIFLKGKIKRALFNDDYLVQKVLKPGYTIITTENAFMMHDARCEAKKNLICWYNQITVIRDNLQWEILELLDKFVSCEFESHTIQM